MKIVIAAIAVSIAAYGSAYAQNSPTPKSEDAERNAFQTPTTGQDAQKQSGPSKASDSSGTWSQSNSEARLNDDPSNKEKPVPPNVPR